MNVIEAGILITSVLALVVIAAFQHFKKRVHARIKGPGNTEFELDTSNSSNKAINITRVVTREGGITAIDGTGHGITIGDSDVRTNITATVTNNDED